MKKINFFLMNFFEKIMKFENSDTKNQTQRRALSLKM